MEIEKALKQAAKEKANEIAHGGADSYSSYKQECGIITGLNMAVYICEDIIRNNIDETISDNNKGID